MQKGRVKSLPFFRVKLYRNSTNKIILKIMKKLFASVLCVLFLQGSALATTLQTQIGDITIPNAKEINEQIDSLSADASLSEDNKKSLLTLYKTGLDTLDQIKDLTGQQKDLERKLRDANKKLLRLASDYTNQQKIQSLTEDDIKNISDNDLDARLEKAQRDLVTAQIELNNASDIHNKVQTLPEKAQNTVTKNNDTIKDLLSTIDKNANPDLFKNRVYALLICKANLENSLFKNKLANLSILQDLANYEQKIAFSKYSRLDKDVKTLSLKKNLDFSVDDEEKQNEAISKKTPQLAKMVESIRKVNDYLLDHRKKNALYQHDYQEVDSALTKVDQMQKDLDNQIKELGKSLVLSRLLNKHLSMLPNIRLSYDLDEVIANLNIYIYELREQTDRLLDVEQIVNQDIKHDPSLERYRNDLTFLYSQRRRVLSELYQLLANELSTTIELKVKFTSYNSIRTKIKSDISEQLFWVKSNQPLGSEFLYSLVPTVKYEFGNLLNKLSSDKFKTHTTKTALLVVLPFILLALIVISFNRKIHKYNNELAMRLDRKNDSIFVTPAAIISNMIMMVPRLSWMVIVGSIVICLSLATTNLQYQIILIMVLHIFVFVFFLQIIKPNALVQRHFSVQPYKLKRYRNLFNQIWIFSLPLLIFANVAETDSNFIYADITSFIVVLLSCTALLVLSIRIFTRNLSDFANSSAAALIGSFIAIIVSLMAVLFVASGYLYSIVTLTNRLAFTCYILLAYVLVSQTLHRMMHVYIFKASLKKNHTTEDKNSVEITTQNFISMLNMSPAHLCSKAFKIVNTALLIITAFFMYIQWNDLASVLRYLDTIQIWTKTEIINGSPVVTDYLSLANILLAVFILIVTSVLNKNLPSILEKLLLIKKGINQKSTSYTVKVITSYLITGFGIICAAGSVGIRWENLQWLVAALSVGLGFGLQEIFANFVSGIILLFERQTRVGDIITLNGLSGTVNKIRIRSTTVMSFENKEVMIPNKEFITSALTNWSLTSTVTKLEFIVGVAYDADVEKAKSLLLSIVNRCRYISKDHSSLIYIKELAASSINICADIYVTKIGERKLTIDYLCRETLSVFAKNNIEIPFDQLDLHVKTLEKDEFIRQLKNGLFNKQEDSLLTKKTAKELSN